MKFFLTLIVLSSCINIYSQSYDQVISKSEMYSDFDSLIYVIENANPHLGIYKNLLGVDVLDNIKNMKSRIDTVNSLASYYVIVALALRTIPEGHTRMLKYREITKGAEWYINKYPNYFDSISMLRNKLIYMSLYKNYASYEKKKRKERLKYDIPLTYVNGQFYSLMNIHIIDKTKNTIDTIDAGDRLIMINNSTVNSFIHKYSNCYSYAYNVNKWDNENRLFYNQQLLKNDSLFGKDLTLVFYSNRLKKRKIVHIVKKGSHIIKSYFHRYALGSPDKYSKITHKVMYFDSTLFIKIPAMDYSDTNYYKNEILKYKNKFISKVIIDVRNNGGGSDYLWEYILSLISDTVLCRHQRLGINNWKPLNRFIGKDIDSLPLFFDPILEQKFRLLSKDRHCFKILPDTNSIRYHGSIYLLHNRESFSSATAFVTFALGCERVIDVGENNGYLGGYGADPFLFQLPYSKLMFIMHSTIHIPVDATCYYDYFWNKSEINVSSTPSFETIIYDYSDKDIYTIDFLKKKDIYFIRAIND